MIKHKLWGLLMLATQASAQGTQIDKIIQSLSQRGQDKIIKALEKAVDFEKLHEQIPTILSTLDSARSRLVSQKAQQKALREKKATLQAALKKKKLTTLNATFGALAQNLEASIRRLNTLVPQLVEDLERKASNDLADIKHTVQAMEEAH